MVRKIEILWLACMMVMLTFCISCTTMYYETMENFGIYKRDILVDRVEEARASQEKAGEQFQSALESFREVVAFDGGELEQKYDKLKGEYDRSKAKAQEVTDRIDSVEKVANDLFDEWEDELKQYSNPDLRRSSEKLLRDTRSRYDDLMMAMRRAESKMPPVLAQLNDQVLFLKHNLNAEAVGALRGTAGELEMDVDTLMKELQRSISEANEFIAAMPKS